MAKDYWFTPTTQDPRLVTGLSPTFIIFQTNTGGALTPPSISEPGASTGLYKFSYGTTQSIVFTIDCSSSVASSNRYITGAIDPNDAVDEKVGYVTDSFGSTSIDPSTVFGKLNRNQETVEGNAVFTKSTGVWDNYSRGSSVLLFEKTLTNTTSQATKA